MNDRISVIQENGEWTYFCGIDPVFRHLADDGRSFQMFTAQLVCQGACRQSDIVGTFGVSASRVKRSVKRYREEGIAAFYQPRRGRGATVMTEEVRARAQELFRRGCSRRDVAERLGVRYDTLRKAINQGRLRERSCSEPAVAPQQGTDKSERSVAEGAAELGGRVSPSRRTHPGGGV